VFLSRKSAAKIGPMTKRLYRTVKSPTQSSAKHFRFWRHFFCASWTNESAFSNLDSDFA